MWEGFQSKSRNSLRKPEEHRHGVSWKVMSLMALSVLQLKDHFNQTLIHCSIIVHLF